MIIYILLFVNKCNILFNAFKKKNNNKCFDKTKKISGSAFT